MLDDPMDALHGVSAGVSSRVANTVRSNAMREAGAQRIASKDKSDRATVEQAIDPRTRMVRGAAVNLLAFFCMVLCRWPGLCWPAAADSMRCANYSADRTRCVAQIILPTATRKPRP